MLCDSAIILDFEKNHRKAWFLYDRRRSRIANCELGGRSASFLDMFLGVWPFLFIKVSTLKPKVDTNGCNENSEKVKKVDQLINFWSFYHYLGVVLHDTPGLILFIGGYLRLNGVFVALVGFD